MLNCESESTQLSLACLIKLSHISVCIRDINAHVSSSCKQCLNVILYGHNYNNPECMFGNYNTEILL